MDKVQKIKTEIERRLKANGAFDEVGDDAWAYDQGIVDAYKSILSFIKSLEKENEPKIKGWVARDRNNALDDINTLIKAIAIVLTKKTILIDSFNTTETPDLSVKGTVTVTAQRVFSLTFTELLRPSEIKAMMNGEGLPTVFEQILKEYNHLLSNHEDNR